jgi:ornithine carbamoyltransferase
MNTKLTFIVYPAVALLSLAAAISAHAQSANLDADRAGYGPTVVNTASTVSRADVRAAAIAARNAAWVNVKDKSGYGPMVLSNTSVRTRADVMAEAIAAREAGFDLQYREGGDIQLAAMQRAKVADTAHVLAVAPGKTAAQ